LTAARVLTACSGRIYSGACRSFFAFPPDFWQKKEKSGKKPEKKIVFSKKRAIVTLFHLY